MLWRSVCLQSMLTITLLMGLVAGGASATPLDDYVAAPDPAFRYDPPAKTVDNERFSANVYHMVSQTWLDKSLVDRTEWEHWIIIYVPKELEQTKALVFINGGSNGGDAPEADGPMGQVAVMTKSIVVDVKQIPNQPLKFPDEQDDRYKERGRSEDAMITYGWDKFLRGGDPIWLARLPMTKAVVRAMDLAQKEQPSIDGFFVCGGSKRGWTTWTVAAVDKRVIGIAPAVIDVLNLSVSLDNHWNAYGFWAPAVGDYADMQILPRRNTERFDELEKIVDPYSYIDRLTMPKYILNGTGDQFFPPNSWQFYFDDLEGEKYLRYIPNTDHGLNLEAYTNLASFYHSVMTGTPRPRFAWKQLDDGNLEIRTIDKPTKVLLWQAVNPAARDFRVESVGKIYTSTPAEEVEPGVYRTNVAAPAEGWTAFLLEMEYPNPNFSAPFKFTTGVSILPDTFPGKGKEEPAFVE